MYRAYEQLLTEILGAPVIEELSRSYPDDYAEIYEEFKVKKNILDAKRRKKLLFHFRLV